METEDGNKESHKPIENTNKTGGPYGRGKIHLHPNAGLKTFDKSPETLRKAVTRAATLKTLMRDLLNRKGETLIKSGDIVARYANGDILVKSTNMQAILQRLLDISKGKDVDQAIKAIEILLKHSSTQVREVTPQTNIQVNIVEPQAINEIEAQ